MATDPFPPSQGYPTIWIPQDSHGFTGAELEATQAAGVSFAVLGLSLASPTLLSLRRLTSRPREPS